MKNLYLVILGLLLIYGNSYAQCIENGGFESGLTGYFFKIRNQPFAIVDCNVDTSDPNFTPFAPSATANSFGVEGGTLVSITGGGDPTLSSALPPVTIQKVHSGNFAFKLNRSTGSSHISTMSTDIVPAGNTISFYYSLIVQNPHPTDPTIQPFFSARIYNSIGQIINNNEICIKADAANPIFFYADIAPSGPTSADVYYTGWQCALLQIPDQYIGQHVRLEYIMTDCGLTDHFGTVYIDDITCDASCASPPMGYIELNQNGFACPTESFEICGTYSAPEDSVLDSIELSIVDSSGNTIYIIPTPSTLTADEFCFTVDPALFDPGEYEFRVDGVFDAASSSFNFELFDQSAIPGPDLTFLPVNLTATSYIDNSILYWQDVSDSYQLEFITDGACCPGGDAGPSNYYAVTVSDNHIPLSDVSNHIQSKCFRWRIKSDCGWSGWCCLAESDAAGVTFPNNEDYGNPLAPQCYEDGEGGEGGLACIACPTITADVASFTFSFQQADVCITAENDIETNAKAVYQAGHYILLQPDFIADFGSFFLATIEDCTTADIPPPNNLRKIVSGVGTETSELSLKAEGFTISPNPTTGVLNIESNVIVKSFTIIDMTGKTLIQLENDDSQKFNIDISQLSPGIYMLYADGIIVQKIIKE